MNLKFEEAFDSLNTDNENDTFEYHSKCKYPYRLRIVNIMQSVNKECLICDKRNCSNCLLPYSDTIKLKVHSTTAAIKIRFIILILECK